MLIVYTLLPLIPVKYVSNTQQDVLKLKKGIYVVISLIQLNVLRKMNVNGIQHVKIRLVQIMVVLKPKFI